MYIYSFDFFVWIEVLLPTIWWEFHINSTFRAFLVPFARYSGQPITIQRLKKHQYQSKTYKMKWGSDSVQL